MTNVSDFVIPRFHPVLGDVMAHGHTHYWLPGGRGSTKSSFISIAIVLLIIANPKANAVVVRRFSNTLRDSVYQQIQWAIEMLGLEGVFRCRVSPMEITYTPTGQRIVFRGADDPLKLKGVKFTKGYCSVVWFEELDQFEGVEAVRSILNSLRRGGDRFWIFYSYNPPKTMWSCVNVERLERVRRDDTLVRGSSYLDVIETHPTGWVRPLSRRPSICGTRTSRLGDGSTWARSPARVAPSSITCTRRSFPTPASAPSKGLGMAWTGAGSRIPGGSCAVPGSLTRGAFSSSRSTQLTR